MDRVIAVALLGLASLASAGEARPIGDLHIPDARLTDAEQFGHFTDLSRPRDERVVSPAWEARYAPRPQAAAAPLLRPRSVPEPSQPMFVPRQQLPPLPDLHEEKPDSDAIGLYTLAAVGMGLGLALWGVTGPRRRVEESAPESPKRVRRRSAILQEELAPIEPWAPSAPAAPFGPLKAPRLDPLAPEIPALPSASWYAITAAEQRAIDQWDRSPEKRLGIASLTEWLDRHQERLPEIDVARLKLKLEREA